MTSAHAVGSLEFEFRIGTHRQAMSMQDRVASLNEHDVPRMIEELFDRFDHPDRTLRLQRIDVNLGLLDHDQFEQALLSRLEKELSEALERCQRQVSELAGSNEALSMPAIILADLSFYFRTGFLPWSADPERFLDLPAMVEELLNEPPRELGTEMLRLFRDRTARARLVANLPETLLGRLLTEALESMRVILEDWRDHLHTSGGGEPEVTESLHAAKQRDLLLLRLEEASELLASTTTARVEVLDRVFEMLSVVGIDSYTEGVNIGGILAQLQQRTTGASDPVTRDASGADTVEESAFEEDKLRLALTDMGTEPTEIILRGLPSPTAADERVEVPSWLVRNAGLVLLWPYLPRYFESIGLATDDALLTRDASRRAMHELQFLAVGDRPYREYDLVLNKVLCGVPLDEPTAFDPDYRHEHLAEAEELLAEVIEHWPRVGAMSVDGLRGSFLLRNGKLTRGDAGFTLRIERTGFDVLLDGLEHPLSVVRLPWMKEVVFVEW